VKANLIINPSLSEIHFDLDFSIEIDPLISIPIEYIQSITFPKSNKFYKSLDDSIAAIIEKDLKIKMVIETPISNMTYACIYKHKPTH
jgi:hypothetical protein